MGHKNNKDRNVAEKEAFGLPWLVYSGEDMHDKAERRRKRYACMSCIVLLLGAAAFFVLQLAGGRSAALPSELNRGQTAEDIDLVLKLEYKGLTEEKDVALTILPEHIDRPRAEQLFDECEEWIKSKLAEGLSFPEEAPNGVVISWQDTDISYIGVDGPVRKALIAQLGAGEYYRVSQFDVVISPDEEAYRKSLDMLAEDLAYELSTSDKESALKLPAEKDGVVLGWDLPKKSGPALLLILSGTAALFIWFIRDDAAKRSMERRRRAFDDQIPNMSFQMILLINAGLVVESAFSELLRQNEGSEEPLYKIMEDIKAASAAKNIPFVSELYCYARKAASPDLMRFSTLVYEHAGRGSSLADKLDQEREMIRSGRLSQARTKVRQAETKLCFPLMLLLLVLIIITASPSFLSM